MSGPTARPLPPEKVSRNQKTDPSKWGKPRMAVVSQEGGTASCNCGWSDSHHRNKVLEDKIDRHLNKRHGGMGLRI